MDLAIQRRTLIAGTTLSAFLGVLAQSGCAQSSPSQATVPTPVAFPSWPAGSLTARQRKLVAILKTEYQQQPPATKYSQGVHEAWCADFVSWVEKAIGQPLSNPNGGSWRIPGTMTLLDYFRSRGVWHSFGSGYHPVTGDVAIYDGSGPFGQHTNYVLELSDGELTTCGGNEPGGIRVSTHRLDAALTVLGFAHLQ